MPKYLEINWEPLVKAALPGETEYIDTKLSWTDVRTWSPVPDGILVRWHRIIDRCIHFFLLACKQDYQVVITRCLGTVNSNGSLFKHLAKKLINFLYWCCVRFAARNGKMLVVVDMLDQTSIQPADFPLLKRCTLYFKRELAANIVSCFESVTPLETCIGFAFAHCDYASHARKLRPISLGVPTGRPRDVDPDTKKWDFFYTGSDSLLPDRQRTNSVLDELKQEGYRVLHRTWLNLQEFDDAIQESWLCISPGGFGWDCYRHYQIPMNGSCPVLISPTIVMHAPYVHGESAFYLSAHTDWKTELMAIIADKDKLVQVSKEAQAHVLKHHTTDKLGAYIVREIERCADES